MKRTTRPLLHSAWRRAILFGTGVWSNFAWPTGREWLALLGIGLFTQIAQVFLTRGLHAERAAKAVSASYLQIVFAATWGILFFEELPDIWLIAGTACVIVATMLATRQRSNNGIR